MVQWSDVALYTVGLDVEVERQAAYRLHIEVIGVGIVFGASVACLSDKAEARSSEEGDQRWQSVRIEPDVRAEGTGSEGAGIGICGGITSFLASANRGHSVSRCCEVRVPPQGQAAGVSFGTDPRGEMMWSFSFLILRGGDLRG